MDHQLESINGTIMSKRTKDKDLEKLDVIKDSPQMSLFEIIESPAKKDDYSNTIEIYDALPKYIWDQKREHEDLSNAVVTRQCSIRGQQFTVKVKPAIIEKDDGRTVLIYAGQREEILEDALRKLAVNGKGHRRQGWGHVHSVRTPEGALEDGARVQPDRDQGGNSGLSWRNTRMYQ